MIILLIAEFAVVEDAALVAIAIGRAAKEGSIGDGGVVEALAEKQCGTVLFAVRMRRWVGGDDRQVRSWQGWRLFGRLFSWWRMIWFAVWYLPSAVWHLPSAVWHRWWKPVNFGLTIRTADLKHVL